jgi:hypothetical protein
MRSGTASPLASGSGAGERQRGKPGIPFHGNGQLNRERRAPSRTLDCERARTSWMAAPEHRDVEVIEAAPAPMTWRLCRSMAL